MSSSLFNHSPKLPSVGHSPRGFIRSKRPRLPHELQTNGQPGASSWPQQDTLPTQPSEQPHLLRRLETLDQSLDEPTTMTGSNRWIMPYADLLTVLLGLILLLLSLSQVDQSSLKDYSKQLKTTLIEKHQELAQHQVAMVQLKTELEAFQSRSQTPVLLLSDPGQTEALDLGDVPVEGSELSQTTPGIEINQNPEGLIIRVLDQVLFESGQADLSDDAKATLDELADVLKAQPHKIRIEGHTDNTPIQTSDFPSNWELSSQRALVILRYLVEHHSFDPTKISAVGYGEYRPVAANSSVQGKQKNRRVDIVVLNQGLSADASDSDRADE